MAKVRATNINIDSESLEEIDGVLVLQEVLAVKLDPAGGLTKGPDGLAAAALTDPVPTEGLSFGWDLVPASLSSATLYPIGSGVSDQTIPYAGNLVALAVRLSGLPTGGGAGCILVKPAINGTPLAASTFDCSFDSGTPTQQEYEVDLTKSETFAAGDRLGLVISSTSGLTPLTLNLLARLVIRSG